MNPLGQYTSSYILYGGPDDVLEEEWSDGGFIGDRSNCDMFDRSELIDIDRLDEADLDNCLCLCCIRRRTNFSGFYKYTIYNCLYCHRVM